jgi:2-iminobutanoate/2-iminopropanoate deaminase
MVMAAKKTIQPKGAPPAVGPYNHAVRVDDLLFSSGQIPLDPATGELVPGDIRMQTERVLDNIHILLKDQGLTMANVVKTTIYLTDMNDFPAVNEAYAGRFDGDFPARSTVQVAGLPKGAGVEIEVVAHY